jgi:hypothetical protein
MNEVAAKTRKRCPHCKRMVEAGERAVLTDDRYTSSRIQDFGRGYRRGAWHLWHPHCYTDAREVVTTTNAEAGR